MAKAWFISGLTQRWLSDSVGFSITTRNDCVWEPRFTRELQERAIRTRIVLRPYSLLEGKPEMKIAIVVQGRLWACDMARALSERGHQVSLFTNYPVWAARRFGV